MAKGIAWCAFALSSILFVAALSGALMESRHRAMIRPLEADLAERIPVVAFDPAIADGPELEKLAVSPPTLSR
jgi:hypothetical protein